MATDLTAEARQGYDAPEGTACPFIATSNCSAAWHVGRWLKSTGRPEPRSVRPSRGYRMWANDMLLDVSVERRIERIQ